MTDRKTTPYAPVGRLMTGLFDTGPVYATWRPHGTDDYLLIYTLGGQGRFGGPAGDLIVGTGDLVLIRPHTPHDYGVEPHLQRWQLVWAHFRPPPEWLDLLEWPAEWPGMMRLRDAESVAPLFHRTHELALTNDPLRERLAMNALEGLLLACARLNPGRDEPRTDPRLRQVAEQVARRLDAPLTVESLAEDAGLSASRLAHLFRAAYGVPVMQYVESCRIERAKQLLRTTALSVKEIAQQVGYASPFYFSLRFKKVTGESPTAYRHPMARNA
jgi:AraC family transcriptional regulator of arabinose operon